MDRNTGQAKVGLLDKFKLLRQATCDRTLIRAALSNLAVLVDRANTQGECWPSFESLANDTGYSVRACKEAVTQLENNGYLKHRRGGRGVSNLYTVRFDKVRSAASYAEQEKNVRGEKSAGQRQIKCSATQDRVNPAAQESVKEPIKESFPQERVREGKEYSSEQRGREDQSAAIPEDTFDALVAELSGAGGYVEAYGYGANCSDEVDAIRNACGDQRAYKRLQGMLDAGMHGKVLRNKLREVMHERQETTSGREPPFKQPQRTVA